MADDNTEKKTRRLRQPTQTVRQQIDKQNAKQNAGDSRARKAGQSAARPFKATGRGVKKAVRPLRFLVRPLRFLAKVLGLRYVVRSWRELRLVTWPNRRQTRQLTVAVLVFSIIFGVVVAVVDYGLNKLFEIVFVN